MDRVARRVADRWTPSLASAGFTPIVNVFLRAAKALGLSPVESLLIIQVMSFKWDEEQPFPSERLLAKRLNVSERTVRRAVMALEHRGLVERERRGRRQHFNFGLLFSKLEKLLEEEKQSLAALIKARDSLDEMDF